MSDTPIYFDRVRREQRDLFSDRAIFECRAAGQ
jgi:hypothetical protein